jgi:ribulose-phosphate 3-epimerase
LIGAIKKEGMKVGMALKPKTTVAQVQHLLHLLDYVLVMTVEPGFGGQKLMQECITKVLVNIIEFTKLEDC